MGKRILLLIFSIAMAIFFVNAFSGTDIALDALDVRMTAKVGYEGGTVFEVPPIGSIRAKTHRVPLKFEVMLKNINVRQLETIIGGLPDDATVRHLLEGRVRTALGVMLLRILALAGIGGGIGAFIAGERRRSGIIAGFSVGILLFGILLSFVYIDYDPGRFEDPQYQGIVEAAPWMLGLLGRSLGQVERFGVQMRALVGNLESLFERVDSMERLGGLEDTLRILHVSDIHNNPVAFDFIEQIVDDFDVDAIIDTGDITDFGTPVEAELAKRIESLGIPYFFVPGNHDSPSVSAFLSKLENVTILTGGLVEFNGIRIFGYPDPVSDGNGVDLTDEDIETGVVNIEKMIWEKSEIASGEEGFTIFATHNHRIANRFNGRFPLILHGHDHRFKLDVNESVIIDAGSTGAAGIRGLQSSEEVPFTLALLHFTQEAADGEENPKYRLLAVDSIKIANTGSGFSLDRTLISKDEGGEKEEI